MSKALLPADEAHRIQALRYLQVLDSAPEEEFDALVNAAALVCGTPISLISLVDIDRQWFKANLGLHGISETPRDAAFCAHAILGEEILEIHDASLDPRFVDNPLVTDQPNIRFYAGAPLRLSNGARIGTLCVIDRQPRQLDAQQRAILGQLAIAAAHALERRNAIKIGTQLIDEQAHQIMVLQNNALLEMVRTQFIMSIANVEGNIIEVNDAFCDISQYERAELIGKNHRLVNSGQHPPEFFHTMWATITSGTPWRGDICNRAKDGSQYWVDSVIVPFAGTDGRIERYCSIRIDITQRKAQEEILRTSQSFLDRTGRLAGVGGWELDLTTNEFFWSDETCRIHSVEPGYRPSLKKAIALYAEEVQSMIEEAIDDGIHHGKSWDLEVPFVQANGKQIWVRAIGAAECINGKTVRLVGAFQDITASREQRETILEAKNTISLATDSGQIGIWDYNILDNTLIWDKWMYRLYDLPEGNATENYSLWVECIHPEDKPAAEQSLHDAIIGIRPFDTEFRIMWKDGSIHHHRSAARVTRDNKGDAIRMVGVNWDVTRLRELASQLAEQHELLRVTLQSIGDAVITTDAQGKVNWLNPVAERMTGWKSADAKGLPLNQVFRIVDEKTRHPAENPVSLCLAQSRIVGLDNHAVLISRFGDEFGIEDSAAPIFDTNNRILGAVLVFHDVTEERRISGEMRYRASHDALTGLVNRAEFESQLHKTLNDTHENRSEHALMYIDLDQFKIVNDACGHSVGDQLLQQVSKILLDTIRTKDTLARLGGDEFAVILQHCTSEQALRAAQTICDRMEDFRFVHETRRFRIGTSIGLVPIDIRWQNTAAVMQAADTSCYAAKEAGRNRVHVWFETDQAMRTRHGEMQWTTKIEQALDEDGFILFAQQISPLIGKNNGMHAEVLLRMLDFDGKPIPPGAFLPAAERFHLASRIDRWVLRRALRWLGALPHRNKIETLSINLSGQSIGDRAFHQHAIETLKAAGKDICKSLCFEITETAAITNMTDAIYFIEQIRALGVRMALDDFGAGAASFGYLKTLSVDFLKIDGQFIKNLLSDRLDDAAVRCFADVAKSIGLKTVAEFVDRPDVLIRLQEIGIDYAQGFLIHKPEPIMNLFKNKDNT